MKSNEKKICCVKCGKTFERTNDFKRHNDRKIVCDLYINKVEEAVIQTDIIENAVSHNEIVELKDIIMVLVEEMRLVREEVKALKPQHISPVLQIPTPISTPVLSPIVVIEKNKTNVIPVVEKIKKVKKVKKTPAPIVPPTTETEVDMSLSVQPVQQAPVLTTIPDNQDPIEYLTKTYETNDNLYSNLKYICKDLSSEWFEKCEDEDLKFYIKDDKCREFIDKCSTIEKKEAFYAMLFEQHLKYNYDLGVLSFYDYKTEHLFLINEEMEWEISSQSTTNPIACLLFDKLNSAVAFTSKFNHDLANDLFKIKHLVSKNEKINDIVKSVLSTLNYDKIRVSI
jgi:hypothetical protein